MEHIYFSKLEIPFGPIYCDAGRKIVTGSLIGGIKETQEMLDFCGEHKIGCEIEKIPVSYINTAMERLLKVTLIHLLSIPNH